MTRQQRAAYVLKRLSDFYPETQAPLAHQDPYTLLVAVVLSARCADARVNTISPKLFALAGSPESMARLPVHTIEKIIRPCGLGRQKAKAIKELSRSIAENYGGRVPASFKDLEALPGVGHKTASVVMAQAFGVAAFPVDTHIHRLARKWGLSRGRNVAETERDLKKLFPENTWAKAHLRMIYYGREYSPARGPKAETCPITLELKQLNRRGRSE